MAGPPSKNRFRETSKPASGFAGDILVECPSCGACAIVRRIDRSDPSDAFAARRLVCSACGFSRDWSACSFRRLSAHRPVDDYFEAPLWLRVTCRSGELWVFNHEHLDYLESYVRAELRERPLDRTRGWANRSLASRLPRWVKDAKHRDEVLRAIATMRARR